MKKKRILVSVLALALLFCGCSMKQAQEDQKNWTTYVINDETCRAVYSCTAEEAADSFSSFEEIDGHVRKTSIDEEGNFVLTLSEDDIAHWKKEMEENFARVRKAAEDSECSLEIGDDYHSITSTVPEEYAFEASIDVYTSVLWCATMQMLNGEDPNEWWVDIKYVDIETGNTVLECKDFPRTSKDFSVNLEDWEKAREGKQ